MIGFNLVSIFYTYYFEHSAHTLAKLMIFVDIFIYILEKVSVLKTFLHFFVNTRGKTAGHSGYKRQGMAKAPWRTRGAHHCHCARRFCRLGCTCHAAWAALAPACAASSPPGYLLRHVVELQTLRPCYGAPVRVMLPRAYLQQQALCTSVEALSRRLVEPREAVLAQQDDTVTAVHRLSQHLFLFRCDSGAHQHAAPFSACEPRLAQPSVLLDGVTAVYYHRYLVGDVVQKTL